MKQNINQDIAMAIFNSTDRPSQSRNIVSLREKVESYVNQRVIEELEALAEISVDVNYATLNTDEEYIIWLDEIQERIKELKQN